MRVDVAVQVEDDPGHHDADSSGAAAQSTLGVQKAPATNHAPVATPLLQRLVSSRAAYDVLTTEHVELAAAAVPPEPAAAAQPLPDRDSTTHPWLETLCWLLGYSVAALKERGTSAGVVLFVALGSAIARATIYLLAFRFGTYWNLWPVYWMAPIGQGIVALVVLRIAFGGPWAEAEKKPALGVALLFDIITHVVPIMYAFTQSGDNYPLARLGQKLWFSIALLLTFFLCTTYTLYAAPENSMYWPLPWHVVLTTMSYKTMRILDPVLDIGLAIKGWRLASQGVCPYRGSDSCAAHYIVLAFMTLCLALDSLAALYNNLVVDAIADPARRRKFFVITEGCGLAYESGIVVCGVHFVSLGMAAPTGSSAGVTLDYVITCATFTAITAVWTVYLLLPAQQKEHLHERVRRVSERVRRASQVFSKTRNIRVAPAQPVLKVGHEPPVAG